MIRRVRSSASCLSSQQIDYHQEFGAFVKWANILLVFFVYTIYIDKQKDPELISGPLYIILNFKAVKLRFTGILLMFD